MTVIKSFIAFVLAQKVLEVIFKAAKKKTIKFNYLSFTILNSKLKRLLSNIILTGESRSLTIEQGTNPHR